MPKLRIADVLLEEIASFAGRVQRENPLLQCIACHNTESPAGAKARSFNHGLCLHCGGSFKVVAA